MKNNNNLNKIYLSIAVLIFLGISFVSAFSVSSPYMENKTLNIFPDSKVTNLQFVLQNGGGATDNVSIQVDVLEGSQIINVTDENNVYTVVPGDKVPVNLRITLPDDVGVGDNYNIRLEFRTVSVGKGGQFGFGTAQEQDFQVAVVPRLVAPTENGTKTNNTLLYVILGILVVLVIIVLVLIKRKNRK